MCHVSWYENCTARGPYAKDFKTTPRAWNKFEHPPPKGDNSNIRLIIRPTSFQAKHCKFTPRLQKWIVGPIFFTELRTMYLSPRNCPWTCCRVVVLLFLKPVGIEGFSHSWKKWLKWNWNGTWERLQEVWALKIGSIEPQVCWGCVGGRGLVVAGDYVIEQGWSCCELASKFGVWGFGATALRFRDCPARTPVHTNGNLCRLGVGFESKLKFSSRFFASLD